MGVCGIVCAFSYWRMRVPRYMSDVVPLKPQCLVTSGLTAAFLSCGNYSARNSSLLSLSSSYSFFFAWTLFQSEQRMDLALGVSGHWGSHTAAFSFCRHNRQDWVGGQPRIGHQRQLWLPSTFYLVISSHVLKSITGNLELKLAAFFWLRFSSRRKGQWKGIKVPYCNNVITLVVVMAMVIECYLEMMWWWHVPPHSSVWILFKFICNFTAVKYVLIASMRCL